MLQLGQQLCVTRAQIVASQTKSSNYMSTILLGVESFFYDSAAQQLISAARSKLISSSGCAVSKTILL